MIDWGYREAPPLFVRSNLFVVINTLSVENMTIALNPEVQYHLRINVTHTVDLFR